MDTGHGWRLLLRDLGAEADALDLVWELGLHTLQWRNEQVAQAASHLDSLWALLQEDFCGDFWAEQLPFLQAKSWTIVVRPGFAHESVAVDVWHLIINTRTGELLGKQALAKPRQTQTNRAPSAADTGIMAKLQIAFRRK